MPTTDPPAVFRRAAAALDGADPGTVALLAALVDAPQRSRTQDGVGDRLPDGRPAARRLRQALAARDLAAGRDRRPVRRRHRAHGRGRLRGPGRPAERAEVDGLHPGLVGPALATLAATVRLAPDLPARARALREGTPTGHLAVPVVTLHTRADERVPAQHETRYRDAVAAAGRADELLQLWTDAPARYPVTTGSAAGAGHCRFTPSSGSPRSPSSTAGWRPAGGPARWRWRH